MSILTFDELEKIAEKEGKKVFEVLDLIIEEETKKEPVKTRPSWN